MADEKLKQEIIEMVSNHSGYNKEKISLETCLLGDMGMDGDDAFEFFYLDFGPKFKVDLAAMQYDRHFGPEGMTPLQSLLFFPRIIIFLLFWILSKIFPRVKTLGKPLAKTLYPLTEDMDPVSVQNLVDAAKAGKWVMNYPPKLAT